MKVEFELTIDDAGLPVIQFKHHYKDQSIEQRLLKVFIDQVNKKGVKMISTSGYAEISGLNSWDQYEFKIND